MQVRFENNEVVVVVGGARRIGRAVALECAQAGARVLLTYRDSRDQAHQTLAAIAELDPGRALGAWPLDITDAAAVEDVADRIDREWGGAHALACCAGLFERTPFDEMNEADFERHIDTNLKGPFLLGKAFGQRMKKRPQGGSMLFFGDIFGERPLANFIPYSVSKAGVLMLTRALAKALAPSVRVNCICPGLVEPTDEPDSQNIALLARIPMNRPGTTDEAARLATFLLADATFVTGAVIPLDGGQSLR